MYCVQLKLATGDRGKDRLWWVPYVSVSACTCHQNANMPGKKHVLSGASVTDASCFVLG